MSSDRKILIVDDESHNRALLRRILRKGGFTFEIAKNGEEALSFLEKNADYATVLLDRMMPGINGLNVLKAIKENERLRDIPVIFQTALAQPEEVAEGIKAGSFYYVTKPYPPDEQLLAIVHAAIGEYESRVRIREDRAKISEQTQKTLNGLRMIDRIELSLQTLEQVQAATIVLSGICPDPDKVVMGLQELLINGVEHGNAGITYDEKSSLNEAGNWSEEVKRRLALPENKNKRVRVSLERQGNVIQFTIKDDGPGFRWNNYLKISQDRIFDNHGRGIAMAGMLSFSSIKYKGCGNEVIAIVTGGST